MDVPKTYRELRGVSRGSELIYKGVRTRCTYAFSNKGGGVGMGEYPAEFTAIFENGLVLQADEWNQKVHEKYPSFKEATPDF